MKRNSKVCCENCESNNRNVSEVLNNDKISELSASSLDLGNQLILRRSSRILKRKNFAGYQMYMAAEDPVKVDDALGAKI